MSSAAHAHPNYMRIFWILFVLTVVEVAVAYMGLPKLLLGTMLIILAIWKAALVALHFMHLKFEAKTLTWIAFTPLAIAGLTLGSIGLVSVRPTVASLRAFQLLMLTLIGAGLTGIVEGVLVTEVEPGSPAEERGIQAGDVVLEVSQEPVAAPEDVTARIEQLKAEGRRSALFLVASRNNDMRFVAIRIEDE